MSRRLSALVLSLALLAVACTSADDPVVATPPTQEAGGSAAGEPTEPASEIGEEEDLPAVILDDEGVVVEGERILFGTDYAVLGPMLEAVLGAPTNDSGTVETDAGCPTSSPTYRFVDFDGLSLTILDDSTYAEGVAHLAQWIAFEEAEPAVPLLGAGDGPRVAVEPGRTTVADLVAALGDDVVVEDEPPLGPSFRFTGGVGAVFGSLSGTGEDDRVFSVLAGEGCGE